MNCAYNCTSTNSRSKLETCSKSSPPRQNDKIKFYKIIFKEINSTNLFHKNLSEEIYALQINCEIMYCLIVKLFYFSKFCLNFCLPRTFESFNDKPSETLDGTGTQTFPKLSSLVKGLVPVLTLFWTLHLTVDICCQGEKTIWTRSLQNWKSHYFSWSIRNCPVPHALKLAPNKIIINSKGNWEIGNFGRLLLQLDDSLDILEKTMVN